MSDVIQPQPTTAGAQQGETKYVSRRGRRIIAAILVILIILLLISTFFLLQLMKPKGTPSQSELKGVTWVRSIYGFGPRVDQLTSPASVAIVPGGGNFILSDQASFRVVEFDENGQYIDVFEGDKSSKDNFDFPSRIALAPDGWLYVVQSTYNNVKVYDDGGKLRQTIEIPNPMSIAVNENIVVIGAQSGFAVYDREGNKLGMAGTRGDGQDQFDTVNGVAVDDEDNAYVVDSFNNRVSKYDKTGKRVWIVETGLPSNKAGANMASGNKDQIKKKYPAMMQVPMGATIDGAGRLIIIDLLDFSVAALDTKDGKFIDKWGDWGHEDGRFAYPADIDYDPQYDWFVVSDSGNRRAQIIRLPDSGGSAAAAARRLLSGPLKACLIPLLLLLLIIIIAVVMRNRRRRQEELAAEQPLELADAPEA